MKILIVTRFFWPDDTPLAAMLPHIVRRWIDDGHEVTVLGARRAFSPQRDFPTPPALENQRAFKVYRVPVFPEKQNRFLTRIINILIFSMRILLHVFTNKKYDVLMTTSFPPVFMGWAVRVAAAKIGAAFVYQCEDIYPEVGRLGGFIQNSRLYNWMLKIDQKNCENADALVVLSEDMKNTLTSRGMNDGGRFHIINSFILPTPEAACELPEEAVKPPGKFRILFAGNIGMFQGLDTVIDAALLLKDEECLEFFFMGEGLYEGRLKERGKEILNNTLFFCPRQSADVASKAMQTADLGLISLKEGVYKVAFPSKTINYLAQGCPVLAVMEPESGLSRFIHKEGVGFVSPPGNAQALKETILQAYRQSESLPEIGEKARRLADETFGMDKTLDAWSGLMEKIKGAGGHG